MNRIVYTLSGNVHIIVPCAEFTAEQCANAVPAGVPYEIVDASEIPADRTFRNAWKRDASSLSVDILKAKDISHNKRRARRAEEFATLDVQATIPAQASQAETARQSIRDKYAAIQDQIESSTTAEQLKAIIAEFGL